MEATNDLTVRMFFVIPGCGIYFFNELEFTDMAIYESAFEARDDLKKYGDNALLLFALQLKFQIQDIDTVAVDALTDGHDDKKCDLIYIDRDSQVAVVAQGYFSKDSGKKEAKANKASDLNTAMGWVLTTEADSLPARIKNAVLELREAINCDEISTIQLWYVHNLPESDSVERELLVACNTASASIKSHYKDRNISVSSLEIGKNTLDQWYKSLTIPILVTEKFSVNVGRGFEISDSNWRAFVTAVPARWLREMFLEHGSLLFSANIRGYLGSRNSTANINNGIKNTAINDSDKFWVYNNGITALVHSYEYHEADDILNITGFSIVNGAQTTGSLGSLEEPPEGVAKVPARFVVCSDAHTVKDIIKYNNSQNKVEAPDFRSNDDIQKRLVLEFTRMKDVLYLGGRRGSDEDIIKRPINLMPSETVGQALAAFHREPWVAYHEKSRIWINDGVYARYFNERTSACHIVMAYSLLRVLEEYKRRLRDKSSSGPMTEGDEELSEFFSCRGSTILATSAIAACLEIFSGRPISDYFRVSLGSLSPSDAVDHWRPVVDAVAPFLSNLLDAAKSGFRQQAVVDGSIKIFRTMVTATKVPNSEVYGKFSKRLLFS